MEKENLPKWEDITKDELGKLYVDNSQYELAIMFGVDKKDIIKKLKEFGLNRVTKMMYDEEFVTKLNDILNSKSIEEED